jgi:hypothetical protein
MRFERKSSCDFEAAAIETEGVAMSVSSPTQGYRELAYRATDGLEIVLLWNPLTDQLTVSVSDERTGAYFELEAGPDEALEVFQHPYAYAASRGVPYDTALFPCWPESPAKAPGRTRPSTSPKKPL